MVITKLELSRGLRSSKTVLVSKREPARAQVFLSPFSPGTLDSEMGNASACGCSDRGKETQFTRSFLTGC